MEAEVAMKWCTYGSWGKEMPSFIGQVVEQQGNSGKIRYAEKQRYPLEWWDMDYVTVHESFEDAIIFMVTHNSSESVLQLKNYLSFETGKKDVDWDELRKTELEIYNKKRNGK